MPMQPPYPATSIPGATLYVLNTDGKGYWSNREAAVHITELKLVGVNRTRDFGELRVYFNVDTWNVNTDGLIYTDKKFKDELCAWATSLGYAGRDISYSEQGMQSENYVSCDVGEAFIESWREVKCGAPTATFTTAELARIEKAILALPGMSTEYASSVLIVAVTGVAHVTFMSDHIVATDGNCGAFIEYLSNNGIVFGCNAHHTIRLTTDSLRDEFLKEPSSAVSRNWICRLNIGGVFYDSMRGTEAQAEQARTHAISVAVTQITASVIDVG